MLVGVVSDTHNNQKNIDIVIDIFNQEGVDLVIHTGDIASSRALERFSKLNCKLIGVYGNNDREELGLEEVADKNDFKFQQPPYFLEIESKKIAIFHEPDRIHEHLSNDIDIVLHGHTHRFRHETKNQTILFNPGESAGILKGKNAIGIINIKNLEIKRVFF